MKIGEHVLYQSDRRRSGYVISAIVNDEWIVCQYRDVGADCLLRADIAVQVGAIARVADAGYYTEDGNAWAWVVDWWVKDMKRSADDMHSANGVHRHGYVLGGSALNQHFI